MKVFGVTSIIFPDPYTIKGSLHIFMCDFDHVERYADILEEAMRISKEYAIDTFIFQTCSDGFHIVSFDIVRYEKVNEILKSLRIETDYPLIGERMHDKFLTLRISEKNQKKGNPRFVKGYRCYNNNHPKSLWHYLFYMAFCGLPEAPKDYNFVDVAPFCVAYDTKFDTMKKFNVNELLEHNAGHNWNRTKDVTRNTLGRWVKRAKGVQ
jgi:hypothetical protein